MLFPKIDIHCVIFTENRSSVVLLFMTIIAYTQTIQWSAQNAYNYDIFHFIGIYINYPHFDPYCTVCVKLLKNDSLTHWEFHGVHRTLWFLGSWVKITFCSVANDFERFKYVYVSNRLEPNITVLLPPRILLYFRRIKLRCCLDLDTKLNYFLNPGLDWTKRLRAYAIF